MGVRVNLAKIHRACSQYHVHEVICSKNAKEAATYHPNVAAALSSVVEEAVNKLRAQDEKQHGFRDGCERAMLNEFLLTSPWKVERKWRWKRPAHINLLESAVVKNWLAGLVGEGGDQRVYGIADSRVAICSTSKGRSPSAALQRSLGRIGAVSVAGGLYPALGFGPSRFNAADAPTRERDLDAQLRPPPPWLTDLRRLEAACLLPPASAAGAAWVRLTLGLFPQLLDPHEPAGPRQVPPPPLPATLAASAAIRRSQRRRQLGGGIYFDRATFGGFPGEGWWRPWRLLAFLVFVGVGLVFRSPPRAKDDFWRAASRVERLLGGRPVTVAASTRRDLCLQWLGEWLRLPPRRRSHRALRGNGRCRARSHSRSSGRASGRPQLLAVVRLDGPPLVGVVVLVAVGAALAVHHG